MTSQYHPNPPTSATSPSKPPFPQDLFPLDFMSFVESTTSPNTLGMGIPDFQLPSPGPSSHNPPHPQQQSGPSSSSYQSTSSPLFESTPSDGLPPSRGGSAKGRSRSKVGKKSSSAQTGRRSHVPDPKAHGQGQGQGMDVDLDMIMNMSNGTESGAYDAKNGQMSQEEMQMRMAQLYGMQGMEGLEAFMESNGALSGLSQGMLQQFEGIHMQSPIIFDPNNPSAAAYNPMAQFLASPPQQGEGQRKGSGINLMNGLITPGASTEMYPQAQTDQMMSPMQLEMLARREQMEGMTDLNMVPLLSPALSQHHNQNRSSSQYTSPVIYPNFSNPNPPQTPLEALQEQSRQFQDQLNALQIRQRQLQATAAAVAASSAHSSPFINGSAPGFPSSGSSGHSRHVTTPGGAPAEPSPNYFTPLSSPALEATRQYHSFSANGGNGQPRHPHPLSALSSPALNPLGSSGGAQQTLSPALHAQNNAELSDPDYLRALVGMMEGNSGSGSMDNAFNGNGNGNGGQQQYQSPSLNPQNGYSSYPQSQNPTYTPNFGPSSAPISASGSGGSSGGGGPGPHRHPLPSKSRPSPLVKPVNHRSHIRTPSMHQAFSQPSSPAVLKGIQPGTYLPAAAMDHRNSIGGGSGGGGGGGNGGGSLTSTPSPVDLTSMMPPPPVPGHLGQKGKGLTPMTPAALMNLGGAAGKRQVLPRVDGPGAAGKSAAVGQVQKALGKKSATTASIGAAVASTSALGAAGTPASASTKKGGRIVTGKRLAARPTGVGVRTATKGAAAAAIAQSMPEPETRRTSHKAAEQKRRDSLKAGFDELRLLLPPINTEALDPESGEPIPGSSAPRLLPKSSLVPDDNPNRGVSKVALLKFSNEYIVKLHEKVDRRDGYIERLRMEVERLRGGGEGEGEEVKMEDGGDLLEFDIRDGEEEDEEGEGDEGDGSQVEGEDGVDGEGDDGIEEDDEGLEDEDEGMEEPPAIPKKAALRRSGASAGTGRKSAGSAPGATKRPAAGRRESSGSTVTARNKRGE